MNKVFEKIIEKLEEKQDIFLYEDSDYGEGKYNAFDEAIEIVKQEAEKYGADTNVGSNGWISCSSGVMPKECITKDGGKMTEKEKALKLIKELREASYNHTYYGKDMAIDEEMAVFLVEEIFEVEEPID